MNDQHLLSSTKQSATIARQEIIEACSSSQLKRNGSPNGMQNAQAGYFAAVEATRVGGRVS